MTSNPQVFNLLEELLESQKSPEEVCRDCPELLPDVQYRWRQFQQVDKQIRTLLPGLGSPPGVSSTATKEKTAEPPRAFGRYQVRSPLGTGGFGAVYLGHDTQLNRLVAIKVLHTRSGANQLESHKALQEARQLAQLRHPGIVAVHDVGVQEGQLYIISDYLDGLPLNQWLQERRPSWPEAARIAAALADALNHVHARLIIHRDVKPANILFAADGAPVLVDFGLALDETQAGGNAKGVIAGTPWYMSPEQAAGTAHRIDGRTDIYSLGVVLYEMLTGRVPFRASHIPELLRQVQDDEPQPPRQLVGEIPSELEQVCLKAMAKRQEDRYTTAADFAADLRRVLPRPTRTGRTGRTGEEQNWRVSSAKYSDKRYSVGREQELAELRSAFESAADGRGRFLCVTGEPGIGKTTLIEDLFDELAASGRPYAPARGRCSERLAGTEAYLPFLEVLESLVTGEESEAAAQVMKVTAPNWYEQIAPLAAKDSSLTRILADSRAASQERLKRELCAFLQEMSQYHPLLLFIDDLHWADASTVDLLAYLGGKCMEMRVLFVFTYRPTELVVNKHPFGPVKLDLQARGVCRELALDFLPRSDIDEYLTLEFPDHTFPDDFVELVHARTEGSPLFMVDLLRYLRDRRVLAQKQGRWELQQSIPNLRRDLPESVRGMIQRKIDQLKDNDRRLLVAASVQGYEFDSAVVARVLEREATDIEDRLDELNRVHAFVRGVREHVFPDGSLTVRYRFVHVLYQNVLYDSLQPTRRASLSAAVAHALMEFCGDKSEEVAADLALLLEVARDFAMSADYFLAAAKNAARIFANQEAIVLARRGIEVLSSLPDTADRVRKELSLQIALGPALFATKDWTAPEVEAAYKRARMLCRELGESADLFPALWGLFLFHIARGEIRTGLEQGAQLLSLAEHARDPALILQAHHALGPTYGLVGDWATARKHLEQAIACYDREEHRTHAFLYAGHDPCVCCLSYGAKSLWMLGYPDQALQMGRDALVLARDLGHPTSLAHTQYSVAILRQLRRDISETLELAEELQVLAADQGLLFYLAGGLVLRGWALVEQGFHEKGMAEIRHGFNVGGATRAHWRPYLLSLLAETSGKTGNITEGLEVLREAFEVAEQTTIKMYEPEMHRLKGELLLANSQQNSLAAEICFREAIATGRRQQAKSLQLRATTSLARTWQRQGRESEAHATLAAILGTYSEGFTTPDLLEAAALLEDLATSSSRTRTE